MRHVLDRATLGVSSVIGSMAKYPKAVTNRDTIRIALSSILKIWKCATIIHTDKARRGKERKRGRLRREREKRRRRRRESGVERKEESILFGKDLDHDVGKYRNNR